MNKAQKIIAIRKRIKAISIQVKDRLEREIEALEIERQWVNRKKRIKARNTRKKIK